MKLKNSILLLLSLFLAGNIFAQEILIPKPQKLEVKEGTYSLGETIKIRQDKKTPELEYLANQIQAIDQKEVKKVTRKWDIRTSHIQAPKDAGEGYYKLHIDKDGVNIAAPDNTGIFYGVQTLLQLIEEHKEELKLPYLEIEDYPKFDYRGMHLDVSRHFYTIDQVKNYLDYLAAYKYNKFHWHLTDDQGWRFEVKKYPKLQEIAAYRSGTMVGAYEDNEFNEKRYGGYYTQEEAKEVVEYAKKLHIDVIPEIEMPGHAQAAVSAYPELGCTDEKIEVWKQWGVSENIFCPSEETFEFLENVIDEVVAIFPYEYIHIGGDEAPKKQWKESDLAQKVMKREGLKDEEELQSYFITRMEKYINSKGKKIIGWDEILEGGLAPNATVMSWTGIEGGIHAAKTGHKAIMTPTSTNYFDYYQGNRETEPLAIGGDLRLHTVYAYNPIPDALSEEEADYIWGTQANLWTEYITNFEKVQYMIFPRMMALTEVAWGTSNPDEYKNFENRVISHFDILDRKGINYSRAIFEVQAESINDNGKISVKLSSAKDPNNIRYTTDGTEPVESSKTYNGPIPIAETTTVKAAYFDAGTQVSAITTQEILITKSTGKKLTLENPPAESYKADGEATLVDGIRGSKSNHGKGWLGFNGNDMIATIDFGEKIDFSKVRFANVDRNCSWIYLGQGATVSVSDDGKEFKEVKSISKETIKDAEGEVEIEFPVENARYLKLQVKNLSIIPDGLPGAGAKGWLFVDEIAVE